MFSWFQKTDLPIVNPKQRLFGSAENALMQVSQKYRGYLKFGEVLNLQGPYISLQALSSAVKKLQHRHPVLRSRLQINPEKLNSYLLEEDDTVRLKIREITRKREDHEIFWQQEWREREKDTTSIGEGLAEFWLLQDPEDNNNENGYREIVVICEHSVSDAISLSTMAHELLIALVGDEDSLFTNSLNWPITMEAAIQGSQSMISKVITMSRFILAVLYTRATNTWPIVRIPIADVNFPLTDMTDQCHSVGAYGRLSKDETQKLIEKCRQEGTTVTSAVSSAILSTIADFIKSKENQSTSLHFSIGADTRRRCIPPVPNHDLSYHVSGIMSFIKPTRDIPTTSEGIWQLAREFGQHMKAYIDVGQVLALGSIMGKIYEKLLDPPNFTELPTCGISSWGILPFREQYKQWKFIGMTPLVNIIRVVMPFTTIQTVNGVLTIAYFGSEPLLSISLLEQLRDGTMQKLNQMIED